MGQLNGRVPSREASYQRLFESATDALIPGALVPGALALRFMPIVDTAIEEPVLVRNAEAPWDEFSSDDYWRDNYATMLPVDQEIIRRVGSFFIHTFAGRGRAKRAIDVGSGTNLYPALLMLPWTEQIVLSDHSVSNLRWLRRRVAGPETPWTWEPFWRAMHALEGYNRISEPRQQLRKACLGGPGHGGIEQYSVFDLPRARWQLGTMFFVAESITEDPQEFRAAIEGFVGALEPGAPFAAAFMAGSDGYPVAGTSFPALRITLNDVKRPFTELGTNELSVELTQTPHLVREGYDGMIVATGVAGGQ